MTHARSLCTETTARWFQSAAAWFFCALLAGCSIPAPPAEKYFDRTDPLGALKGFTYAVEAEQWDYAFDSLTEESREEIGRWKFRIAIQFLTDPVGDVSIYTLLTNVFVWAPLVADSRQARIRIVSRGSNSDGKLVVRALDVVLLFEDEEWRLDLLTTAERLADSPQPADSDRHNVTWVRHTTEQ